MELLRLLPPVLRARGFRLYLETGKRLTDLWQMGGKAVLGHKPPRVIGELKNSAERGLFAPFPHHSESRFLKALTRLFPAADGEESGQYCFRLYNSGTALEKALSNAGIVFQKPFVDPSLCFMPDKPPLNEQINISLWRPFLNENILAPLIIPALPFPLSPSVLVFKKSLDSLFPPGDLIPPVNLAVGARAVYDLAASGKNGGRPVYRKINKALAKGKKWRSRCIYLSRNNVSDMDNSWPDIWKHFLENGFLLPPSPAEPLILPGELSNGEETKLAGLLCD